MRSYSFRTLAFEGGQLLGRYQFVSGDVAVVSGMLGRSGLQTREMVGIRRVLELYGLVCRHLRAFEYLGRNRDPEVTSVGDDCLAESFSLFVGFGRSWCGGVEFRGTALGRVGVDFVKLASHIVGFGRRVLRAVSTVWVWSHRTALRVPFCASSAAL